MKSKLVLGPASSKKQTYPVLKRLIPGKYSGSNPDAELVVMFTSLKDGMAVHSNLEHPLGQVTTWIEATDPKCWEDFTGEVILSN